MNAAQITKLGVICGGGDLPSSILTAAKNQGLPVFAVGIKGFAKRSTINCHDHLWANLGSLAYVGNSLKKHQVSHICFAGNVSRPSLLSLKLDSLARQLLFKYLKAVNGDNSLLTLVIKIFEDNFNLPTVALQQINPSLLVQKNFNTVKTPTKEEYEDIYIGAKAAKELGRLDIGQSVVVQQKLILALEGVEGTANLIKRSASLVKRPGGNGAILVKVKKPNQDYRIDMPTIGIKTLKQIKKAKLVGIALEANSVLILNPDEILQYANKHNILVKTF